MTVIIMMVFTSRDKKFRDKIHTFIILVELPTANYYAFCCFSKHVKEKRKSVVYTSITCLAA